MNDKSSRMTWVCTPKTVHNKLDKYDQISTGTQIRSKKLKYFGKNFKCESNEKKSTEALKIKCH